VFELLFMALGGGAVTILLARKVNGVWLNGATMFWVSWIVLIAAAVVISSVGVYPPPGESSIFYTKLAFAGAFGGSVLGILLAGKPQATGVRVRRRTELVRFGSWVVQRSLLPLALALGIVGTIHFVQVWSAVDFDIARMFDVRKAYPDLWPWPARIGSYLSLGGLVLAVFMGLEDAEDRVRARRLVVLWVCQVPQGLAFGGRLWTLVPLIMYLFSLLLSRNGASHPIAPRRMLTLVPLFAVGFWVWTVLGIIRHDTGKYEMTDATSVNEWGQEEQYMAVSWLGSSLRSLGVHSDYVSRLEPSYGHATFDYVFRKFDGVGGVRFKVAEWDRWRLMELRNQVDVGSTWCVPPTAIPYLILDFGVEGMPIALGLLIALVHWVTIRWLGQGVLRHVIAFLAFNTAFNTIQTLVVLNSLTVGAAAWAALLEWVGRRARRLEAVDSGTSWRSATLAAREEEHKS
jgi:hypothetical protein